MKWVAPIDHKKRIFKRATTLIYPWSFYEFYELKSSAPYKLDYIYPISRKVANFVRKQSLNFVKPSYDRIRSDSTISLSKYSQYRSKEYPDRALEIRDGLLFDPMFPISDFHIYIYDHSKINWDKFEKCVVFLELNHIGYYTINPSTNLIQKIYIKEGGLFKCQDDVDVKTGVNLVDIDKVDVKTVKCHTFHSDNCTIKCNKIEATSVMRLTDTMFEYSPGFELISPQIELSYSRTAYFDTIRTGFLFQSIRSSYKVKNLHTKKIRLEAFKNVNVDNLHVDEKLEVTGNGGREGSCFRLDVDKLVTTEKSQELRIGGEHIAIRFSDNTILESGTYKLRQNKTYTSAKEILEWEE